MSKCTEGRDYHKYDLYIDNNGVPQDNPTERQEICIRCGHRIDWPKVNGQIVANEQYLEEHVVDFAQPYGITRDIFLAEYGEPKPISERGTNGDYDPISMAKAIGQAIEVKFAAAEAQTPHDGVTFDEKGNPV